MKNIIAFLVAAAGVISGLYVGVWILFIQPIIQACAAFDAGTLTGMIVGAVKAERICREGSEQ